MEEILFVSHAFHKFLLLVNCAECLHDSFGRISSLFSAMFLNYHEQHIQFRLSIVHLCIKTSRSTLETNSSPNRSYAPCGPADIPSTSVFVTFIMFSFIQPLAPKLLLISYKTFGSRDNWTNQWTHLIRNLLRPGFSPELGFSGHLCAPAGAS